LALAVVRDCCALVWSIVASTCPALTESPTFTRIDVTVPLVWKSAVELRYGAEFPLPVTVFARSPRLTVVVRAAAVCWLFELA